MTRLDELAREALATPSSSAPDALEVLVDALLEAGLLPEDGHETWRDAPVRAWQEPTFSLRRRAHQWAKRRLVPEPTALERVADHVRGLLEARGLPYAVAGVVSPFVLRVHFVAPAPPETIVDARAALDGRLYGPITLEVTARAAR